MCDIFTDSLIPAQKRKWLPEKKRKGKERKGKERKGKETPFGVNLMKSQVLYRAAQVNGCHSMAPNVLHSVAQCCTVLHSVAQCCTVLHSVAQ